MLESVPDANKAFHFPQGLAGFSDATEYGFIYHGRGDIICIQSIDQPEASFLITPWDEDRLGAVPTLSSELCACIQVNEQADIMWMLVLNPFADKQWVTANLKAPVALNIDLKLGLQCIRQDSDLDIRYPWMPQPG
ncbi:MAG: flagellar assembly protein FliW [Mariprofundus sp.]|nr:flagellar assembly protein FliW [Mariprofundus sp.]